LKKVKEGGDQFLNLAKKEAKEYIKTKLNYRTEKTINLIFADKIDDLKKLRQNIIRMSPKTCSSRCKFNLFIYSYT